MSKKLIILTMAVVGFALSSAGAMIEMGYVIYQTSGTEAWVAGLTTTAKAAGVTALTIPAYVTYGGMDYTVTQIISHAFENCTTIATINLGVNVRAIGESAFGGCSSLATVYSFSPELTTIGNHAFDGCSMLANFYVMAAATGSNIAADAFAGINDDATLHTVGGANYAHLTDAFKNAAGWSAFTTFSNDWLWMSVDTDGGKAYYRIAKGAQNRSATGEMELLTVTGSTYAPTWGGTWTATQLKGSSATNASYRITRITPNAFNGNTTCTAVDLTGATYLTTLSDHILNGSAVATFTFGANTAAITANTFNGATRLARFVVPSNNTAFSVAESGTQLYNKAGTTLYRCAPAAGGDRGIDLSPRVTTIWYNAFRDRQHLTQQEIPPTVTAIYPGAFAEVPNLQWVQIPGTAQLMEDARELFYGDTNLRWVILNRTTAPAITAGSTFYGCTNVSLVVPVGSTGSYYANADYASLFKDRLWTGSYDFIQDNIAYTVYNTDSYTRNGVTYDGGCARVVKCMNPLRKLVTAYYEAGENHIEKLTFTHPTAGGKRYYCDEIGDSAYTGNRYVREIEDATGNIVWIYTHAFRNCPALETVKLKNAQRIYSHAFRECGKLSRVNFGEMTSLDYIGISAFHGCTSLTDVDLSRCDRLSQIHNYAFNGCTRLRGIEWPQNRMLKRIGDYAFAGVAGPRAIILPYGVETVGRGAFAGMTGVERMNIPSSVTSLGSQFAMDDPRLRYLGINTAPAVASMSTTAALEFGTTLTGDLTIDVPNGTIDAWAGKAAGLATYLHDGGSFDFGDNDPAIDSTSVYYTVTKPTTSTTTRGEVSVVEIPSFVRADIASFLKDNILIPATKADQGFTYDVTAIDRDAYFVANDIITRVQLPASVKTIGANAFRDCGGLNCMGDNGLEAGTTVPATLKYVTSIGANAFRNCNLLGTLDCGDNLSNIGAGAFLSNALLRTIILRRYYNSTTLGTDVWTKASNENLRVLVEYRGFDYYNSQAATWTGDGAGRLVPYVYPNFDFRGAAVDVDLNLSEAAMAGDYDKIMCYYVSGYDRRTGVAQTTRINGNVKAGEGFFIMVNEEAKATGTNAVGETICELPRATAAVSGNQLGGNLLTGITTSDYSSVAVGTAGKFYVLSSEGKYENRKSNFNLYADSYFRLPAADAGLHTTIPLDLVYTGLHGDVNGDGAVNATDLGIIVNLIAGLDQASKYDGRADLNGDNVVNATDLGIIINLIAGVEL